MKHFFGIDFGTTNSCIAWVNNYGQITTLQNADDQFTTPSAVFFDFNNVTVGEYAKSSIPAFPEKIVINPKRKLGKKDFAYQIVGKQWNPVQIAAIILKKLSKDVAEKLGFPVEHAVLSCPNNFTIEQRELLKAAAQMAGIQVHAIINESLAAAIAYGYNKNIHQKTTLVVDLGGGTFDLSLLEISKNRIDVLLNEGSSFLGGKDWDTALAKYIAHQYSQQTGDVEDLMLIPEMRIELTLLAEEAKKQLTRHEKANVRLWYKSKRLNIEISRTDFEKLAVNLFIKVEKIIRTLLNKAITKGIKNIDEVLLVGGGTYMPKIQALVNRLIKAPVKIFKPDQAVAQGTALLAHQHALNFHLKQKISVITGQPIHQLNIKYTDPNLVYKLKDEIARTLPFELGFDNFPQQISSNKIDYSLGLLAQKNGEPVIYNFVRTGQSLPLNKKLNFGTQANNQQKVKIEIFENQSQQKITNVKQSEMIGHIYLEDIPPNLPENTPIIINIEMDELANLMISAKVKKDGLPIYAEFIFTEIPDKKWINQKTEQIENLNII